MDSALSPQKLLFITLLLIFLQMSLISPMVVFPFKISSVNYNGNITQNDKERNSLNYKTILCKNLEGKNKTCKYSALCSYVHGENELRKKYDNLCQTPLMIPNIT